MIWAILAFSILFFILCYKRTINGVYVICAFLPAYIIRFAVLGIPLTVLEAMILILFVAALLKKELKWDIIRGQKLFWPLAAILVLAAVSVVVSPDKIRALGIYKAYFMEPALFFAVVVSLADSRKKLENIFWCLGLSALYLSLFSLWQKFSGWDVPQAFLKKDGSVDRVTGVFGYPNALGLYLGPIIILYFGWLLERFRKDWQTVLKAIIIILGILIIFLAQSEGAILAVAIAGLGLSLYWRRTRLAALIFTALAAIIFLAVPALHNPIYGMISQHEWSRTVRLQIWKETWAMLRDNWLLGAGLAGYQLKIAPYHAKWFEIYLYPHNIFLNFWSELGLLGLLAVIWLEIEYFKINLKSAIKKYLSKLPAGILSITLIAVMAEIIIHGLVDVPYFKNDLSVLFWIFLAATAINDYLIKNENARK